MLGKYDKECRHNHHNGAEIKARCIKRRESKPCCLFYMRKIYHTHENGQNVTCYDADEYRNNGNKTTTDHRCHNGHRQGKHGNNNCLHLRHSLSLADKSGHAHGKRSKLKPDNSYHRTHSRRWEQCINPRSSYFIYQKSQNHESQAKTNKSPLRIRIRKPRRRRYRQNRRNKSKTRPQVRRQSPFTDE